MNIEDNSLKSNYINLVSIKEGETIELCGLSESSKELMVYLNKKNITLGTQLKVQHIENFDKSFEILLKDNSQIVLSHEVCKSLLVKRT